MSIEHEPTEPAQRGDMRPTGDPLQMTEVEKRAAEREARHDVAARGRRTGPDSIQHYFARGRLAQPVKPHRAAEHGMPQAQQPVRPVPSSRQPRQPRQRGLLWRLLHRGD